MPADDVRAAAPSRTVVLTGATSGLGRAAALAFAREGFRVILVARDPARGAALVAEIRQGTVAAEPAAVICDLADSAALRLAAREIRDLAPRIDVLVNNAGAIFPTRQVTSDGIERTFATNHLAYFTLTRLLLDRLLAADSARILCTASKAHRGMRLDFADLQSVHRYRGYGLLRQNAYGRSKLCNLLFIQELARRLTGSAVTVNAFHPGIVTSTFGAGAGGAYGLALRLGRRVAGLSAEASARTLLALATAPALAGVTGGYFERGEPVTPSRAARDPRAAHRLWLESARLAGLDPELNPHQPPA
ncbi:hypothetical protein CDN99_10770 [Roseateles aquatilis]|uniref:Short-chain dehydrogenase n=1 Tax=Roseateles aquatilis TaxID=431061 RepID=A0A246JDM3_9BURK|nr:SDR family NAD(P)-dependent oxidoreductase [Roseateles aquatilis]OWQ90670.1 hypothetical protein CDN99_10770 [Roseateles aquatilis]